MAKRRNILFPVLLASIAFILWVILRVILWGDLGLSKVDFSHALGAFGIGLWLDIWTLAYLAVPWLIATALMPDKWSVTKTMSFIRWSTIWLVTAILIFGIVSEFIFWQEFTTRFNFIAVDYLIYTNEVIGNIRESYPVPLIFTAIGIVASILVLILRKYFQFNTEPRSFKQRLAILSLAIALPIASFYVANVDQMEHSTNAYANELSGNGVFSLAAAMRRNELDYDKFYKTIQQAEADKTLINLGLRRIPEDKGQIKDITKESDESAKTGPFIRKPKNIVLISVESLSAEYMGIYGDKGNLTPKLDKLASEGLQFDHFFATGTRTVRGLEALSVGTPPIPGQAIIHRPNNEHMSTIGELLQAQGYESFFIYGGYGVFDNMNNFFRSNDYKVIDRTDFDPKEIAAENVWGVADESLFNHSIKVIDKVGDKPFFVHIMTTSNHRPYTYPDGRIDIPSGKRKGAVKYTDYAIGKFIEDSKDKPWFKDTLFVIVADHCASVAGKTKLPVAKYHIPLIFYAPDLIKPQHYSRMASQVDVPPTLLDLLGAKGSNHYFGENMFAAEKKPARAFISNYQELGYYKDDKLIVLSPKQKTQTFKVDPETLDSEPTEMDSNLLQEAIAYYQTASRAFKLGKLKVDGDK